MTIKDVAAKAGVSVATVSRVMNASGTVNPETEKLVQSVIDELEYSPNGIASSLKTDRTHIIGYVVTDIRNTVFTFLMAAIQNVLWEYNYSMMLFSTNGDPDKEASILRFISMQKIDGAILNSCTNTQSIIQLNKKIPVVLTGNDISDPNFIGDFVDSDNHAASYMLTSNLLSNGHRKIGIINGPNNLVVSRERFRGYQDAMAVLGMTINIDNPLVYEGSFDVSSGYLAAKKMLSSASMRPTALLVTNNEMMKGVLKYCSEQQIKIPDDLSVVTIGNRHELDYLYISPTYMETNLEEMGERLARLILERIETKKRLPKRIFKLPAFFHDGNTVKPLTPIEANTIIS
ncbi:LacI family DNA-binding transcriptional regulator [Ruminococcus sp. YH-rum2234]|uniref:LacI family DNA-binding transcriptional regulator n=1 Tax=Fusibacillus kribbianus TaxID=3044208 RepID=A0AAP4EXB9_9FIRM|nr:LacI family DNA-binding transcriptional regulator [Ruminococcus sp. YH-rum2234]MDI9242394.1 LacI family DNA-binding transcriptional regulator [Ruminococcus sp. YH-rum2234]